MSDLNFDTVSIPRCIFEDIFEKAKKFDALQTGEKTAPIFKVRLLAAGDKKIGTLKAVREATGLGLRETKALVESHGSPVVLQTSVFRDAEQLARNLRDLENKVDLTA